MMIINLSPNHLLSSHSCVLNVMTLSPSRANEQHRSAKDDMTFCNLTPYVFFRTLCDLSLGLMKYYTCSLVNFIRNIPVMAMALPKRV